MKINWFKITISGLEPWLEHLILFGEPPPWYNLLNYFKIGNKCKDCGEFYTKCKCNYCNLCKFTICACSNYLNNKGPYPEYYSDNELALIRTKVSQFMIRNLNKKKYKNILSNIKLWYSKNKDNDNINNSENLEHILKKIEFYEN